MSAAPRFVHESAPAGDVWNCAEATPVPSSAESEVTVSVPATLRAARGCGDRAGRWLGVDRDGAARPAGSRPRMEERGDSPFERPVTGHVGAFEGGDAYRRSRAAHVPPDQVRRLAALDVVVDGSRPGRARCAPAHAGDVGRHRNRRECLARRRSRRPRRRCPSRRRSTSQRRRTRSHRRRAQRLRAG